MTMTDASTNSSKPVVSQWLAGFFTANHYGRLSGYRKLLLPLSWGYQLGLLCYQWLYHLGVLSSVAVDVPVLSIGNLSAGGTGKTPTVMAFARQFLEDGLSVVILSRGYGATEPLTYGQPKKPEHGDEPWLIQSLLPKAKVIVGANRSKNALKAIEDFKPDVIILDDGFQHLKLKRTVDLVLIDGEKALGNKQVLPLGPLREPVSHLKRADFLVISKSENPALTTELKQQFQVPVHTMPFAVRGCQHWFSRDFLNLGDLKERSAIAFSGIGQPDSFETQLKQCQIKLANHLIFDDHHNYTSADIDKIETAWQQTGNGGTLIITTEKDRVKVQTMLPKHLWPYVYSFITEPEISEMLENDVLKQLNLHAKIKATASV